MAAAAEAEALGVQQSASVFLSGRHRIPDTCGISARPALVCSNPGHFDTRSHPRPRTTQRRRIHFPSSDRGVHRYTWPSTLLHISRRRLYQDPSRWVCRSSSLSARESQCGVHSDVSSHVGSASGLHRTGHRSISSSVALLRTLSNVAQARAAVSKTPNLSVKPTRSGLRPPARGLPQMSTETAPL